MFIASSMNTDHVWSMIIDIAMNTNHVWSMIIDLAMNIDRQWSLIHEHNYSWSMIVAMKCYWSYMISVDQWVISWSLAKTLIKTQDNRAIYPHIFIKWCIPWKCHTQLIFSQQTLVNATQSNSHNLSEDRHISSYIN